MKRGIWLIGLLAMAGDSVAQGRRAQVPAGTTVVRNLGYVERGYERQRLDLYLPERADGPLPVIVWVHGGAWLVGSKEGGRAGPPVRRQGLRRGEPQLSPQPAGQVSGPNRGLQGGDPLAPVQRPDVQP